MVHEQETREIVMLAFRAAKFGEAELAKACKAYLEHREEAPEHHGKMKLKDLMQKDQGANVMEIEKSALRGFERVAGKYNVDFAVTKDKTKEPPLYQIFFKGRDQDVIVKAFRDYVSKREKQEQREPFIQKLQRFKEKADAINMLRAAKEKHKTREKSL